MLKFDLCGFFLLYFSPFKISCSFCSWELESFTTNKALKELCPEALVPPTSPTPAAHLLHDHSCHSCI